MRGARECPAAVGRERGARGREPGRAADCKHFAPVLQPDTEAAAVAEAMGQSLLVRQAVGIVTTIRPSILRAEYSDLPHVRPPQVAEAKARQ